MCTACLCVRLRLRVSGGGERHAPKQLPLGTHTCAHPLTLSLSLSHTRQCSYYHICWHTAKAPTCKPICTWCVCLPREAASRAKSRSAHRCACGEAESARRCTPVQSAVQAIGDGLQPQGRKRRMHDVCTVPARPSRRPPCGPGEGPVLGTSAWLNEAAACGKGRRRCKGAVHLSAPGG